MLTKVEVYTAQGTTLSLPTQDPSAGYVVKNIDGLDPVKANMVSSPFAKLEGEQYQNSRREKRNVVITLGLEADYISTHVRALRTALYNYLMPKSSVVLRFFMDDVHFADISGRVESFETPLFSRDPEVSISVLCFDPDFVAPIATTLGGSTVSDQTEITIEYSGTVETGLVFSLSLDRAISELTLYSRPPGGDFQALEFVTPLFVGDSLQISTVAGDKKARVIRNGSDLSVLYGVSPTASWLNLYPGTNLFRAYAEGAPIPYSIDYTAKYGGL